MQGCIRQCAVHLRRCRSTENAPLGAQRWLHVRSLSRLSMGVSTADVQYCEGVGHSGSLRTRLIARRALSSSAKGDSVSHSPTLQFVRVVSSTSAGAKGGKAGSVTAREEAALCSELAEVIPWAPQVMGVSPLYLMFASAPSDGLSPRDTVTTTTTTTTTTTVTAASTALSSGTAPASAATVTTHPPSGLTMNRRRVIRSRFRSMRNALLHMAHMGKEEHWGIYVSYDGALVTRAASEAEAGAAFAPFYVAASSAVTTAGGSAGVSVTPPSSVAGANGHSTMPVHSQSVAIPPALPPLTASTRAEDFCHPVEGETEWDASLTAEALTPEKATALATSSSFERVRQRRAAMWATLTRRRGPEVGSLLETYMPYFGDDFTPPPPPPPLQACSTRTFSGTATEAMDGGSSAHSHASSSHKQQSSASVFTPQMLVPLLPTYFIPLSVFLQGMPEGYSLAHVERIFAVMGTIDLVRLPVMSDDGEQDTRCGERESVVDEGSGCFIRLHGGRSRVAFGTSASAASTSRHASFSSGSSWWGTNNSATTCSHTVEEEDEDKEGALAVHRRFAHAFAPDPFLCDAFLPALQSHHAASLPPTSSSSNSSASSVVVWHPLRAIVEPAPVHILRALGPFQALQSLLFFGQMQHRFYFAAERGGSLAAVPTTSVSVLSDESRRSNTITTTAAMAGTRSSYTGVALREETTPIPIAVAEVVAVLRERGRVYVSDFEVGNDRNRNYDGGVNGYAHGRSETLGECVEAPLRLSDYTKRAILMHFGTLRHFLAAHADIFACEMAADADGTDHMKVSGDNDREKIENHAVTAAAAVDAARPHRGSGFAPRSAQTATDAAVVARLMNSPLLTVRLAPSRAGGGTANIGAAAVAITASAGADAPLRINGSHSNSGGSSYPAQRHSLEEKLEKALMRKDRRAAQKARRRLAIAQSPDTPYSDPLVLLDAMLRYLPARRPVSVRYFLKSLPPGLSEFLPEVPLQLIRRGVPEKVQLFEWRRRNHLYLMRPGVPLPDGRLRDTYTEEELLYIIVAELQRRGVSSRSGDGDHHIAVTTAGTETLSGLFSCLPYGARMGLGGNAKHFFEFLQRHPQTFLIVFPDAVRVDVRAARVTLLAAPDPLVERGALPPADWDAAGEPPTAVEAAEWHADDEAAMRER